MISSHRNRDTAFLKISNLSSVILWLIFCFTRRKVQRYSYKRRMIMRWTGSRAARSTNEHFFHAIPEVRLFPRRNRKNRRQRLAGGDVKGNILPLFRFTFVVSLLECDELWKTLAVSPRYASPAGMTNSSFSTFFMTVLQLCSLSSSRLPKTAPSRFYRYE
jgi:hypothetical protein